MEFHSHVSAKQNWLNAIQHLFSESFLIFKPVKSWVSSLWQGQHTGTAQFWVDGRTTSCSNKAARSWGQQSFPWLPESTNAQSRLLANSSIPGERCPPWALSGLGFMHIRLKDSERAPSLLVPRLNCKSEIGCCFHRQNLWMPNKIKPSHTIHSKAAISRGSLSCSFPLGTHRSQLPCLH